MRVVGMGFFGAIILLLQGFVTLKLWDWFLVPLDFPALSLWHVMGISLLVKYVTQPLVLREGDDTEPRLDQLFADLIWAVLVLAFGLALHTIA